MSYGKGEYVKSFKEYKADINRTFHDAYIRKAQDIILIEGERPAFRVKGVIMKMSTLPIWTIETFDALLIVTQMGDVDDEVGNTKLDEGGIFEKIVKTSEGSHDFNLDYGENRLRCHMYSAFPKGSDTGIIRSIQAVLSIRVIPNIIPELSELNLPNIAPIFTKKSGLLLVSGKTGDGKSTTVASIINEFNRMTDKKLMILTLEDPVEFVHKNDNSWIVQRRVGENVPTYGKATEDALREDADIVVIGELRKAEEMHNALRLAEVGKLVISTIHANGVEDTIERYVSEFPGDVQEQVRSRLKENLIGIIHQNLISVSNEQYPLASMMLVEGESQREVLRKNGHRGSLEKVLNKFGRYGISREEGFNALKKRGIVSEADRDSYV